MYIPWESVSGIVSYIAMSVLRTHGAHVGSEDLHSYMTFQCWFSEATFIYNYIFLISLLYMPYNDKFSANKHRIYTE